MKAELEEIGIKESQQSFQFFRITDTVFRPFWHYHPELELTLISKGDGTRFIGDSIETFSNWDLVLVGKNLPHHWVSATPEHNQEAFVFQFSEDVFQAFKECSNFSVLFEKAKQGIHFNTPHKDVIESILNFNNLSHIQQLSSLLNILDMLYDDDHYNLLTSKDYALRIHSSGTSVKMAKTTRYILEHLHERMDVNRMSEFTHMVPQSFCRWFKKQSGHSFISFLNRARIEKACQILLTTTTPIQEVAFSCGFESLSHFNRTFKQLKGMSPRAFRQNSNIKTKP